MNGKPAVSVIVPVYNAEKYLDRCIDSLLKQTLNNIEIILINDGSSDKSLAICQHYASMEKNVLLINQENRGVSIARNAGIEIASADLIGFVDNDDYVSPDYFGYLYAAFKSNPDADLAISGFTEVSGEKQIRKTVKESFILERTEFIEKFFDLRKKDLIDMVTNKLYKKAIMGNLRFQPDIQPGEDTLFNLEYFTLCKKFFLINREGYYYIRRADSSIGQFYGIYNQAREMENFMQWRNLLASWYIKNGIARKNIEAYYDSIHPFWFYTSIQNVMACKTPYGKKEQIQKIKSIMKLHSTYASVAEKSVKSKMVKIVKICSRLKSPFLIWIFFKTLFGLMSMKRRLKNFGNLKQKNRSAREVG